MSRSATPRRPARYATEACIPDDRGVSDDATFAKSCFTVPFFSSPRIIHITSSATCESVMLALCQYMDVELVLYAAAFMAPT
eukprot:CAMPEP_0184412986 /NCGR_PEP_ID=MMETSP0738-20130409/6902_1 /TAXON_ID=385413 /ORGANISM="Thalassiosira miniscula, Strain CCMP1093" /LENGTH=81 /DNA_ID=CAMNT_0026771635 /DNA_START=22 /DNA_END=267 /DNA_ORIENTATION=+